MTKPPRDSDFSAAMQSRWTVFLQVAQAGSLTLAAAESGSSQPVISRQLAALEAQCGARLFQRTGRGMALTEFGLRLLPRVQAMFNEARRLSDEVQSARGVPMGDVHVGLLPAAVTRMAEQLVREVRTRFPHVRLHMTEGTSVQLGELVTSGRLDMAVLLREGLEEDPTEPTLSKMALHLIGSATDHLMQGSSIPFSRLAGLPLVLPPQPHALRNHLDGIAMKKGMRLTVAVEANSISLQREIAAAGGSYAIVAGGVVAADAMAKRLGSVKIVAPTLWRRVVLSSTALRPDVLATREVRLIMLRMGSRLFTPDK